MNYVGGDYDGRSGHRRWRGVHRSPTNRRTAATKLQVLDEEPAPCPRCHNRHYDTPNGGDAREDPCPTATPARSSPSTAERSSSRVTAHDSACRSGDTPQRSRRVSAALLRCAKSSSRDGRTRVPKFDVGATFGQCRDGPGHCFFQAEALARQLLQIAAPVTRRRKSGARSVDDLDVMALHRQCSCSGMERLSDAALRR